MTHGLSKAWPQSHCFCVCLHMLPRKSNLMGQDDIKRQLAASKQKCMYVRGWTSGLRGPPTFAESVLAYVYPSFHC